MQVKRFVKQLYSEAMDDNITDVGAMMAYYAVMALFPMLVFVLSMALLVLPDSAIHEGVQMAASALPGGVRDVLSKRIDDLIRANGAHFAIIGAVLALWGARGGAASLMTALNVMFNKKESRSWVRRQLTALAVTLGVAVLAIVALALLVVGPPVGHWLADRFGLGEAFDTAWGIGRWVGAGVLIMIVWAVCYKFLPNTDAPFRIFTPGAIVGVLLWLGISALFGLYLGHFNSYEATYGALGTAIVFLTWLWLSNIALLFGAEINDVLADFRKHEDPAAAQLAHPTDHSDQRVPPHTGEHAHAT